MFDPLNKRKDKLVAVVVEPSRAPSIAEPLTGRTPENEINVGLCVLVGNALADVVTNCRRLVVALERFESRLCSVEPVENVDPGPFEAGTEPPSAAEQVECPHQLLVFAP